MSHLIESYSLASGLTINQPSIYQSFFPVPFPSYVLFHSGSGMPAKNYDYFPEVVAMVRPILTENGYELMQIGGKDDSQITGTIDLRGKTNLHQTAYLIKRASLVCGTDSCNIHFASGFDIPLVALYGSTSPKNSGPYFGNKEKQIVIEADRKGKKPSFVRDEQPKVINRIKPEQVAQAILHLLKIDKKINIETLYIGPQYNNFVVELIMDFVVTPELFQGSVLNARLDYLFDEKILAQNLSIRPLCILTDQPININILKKFRKNVATVIYDLTENFSVDFVKQMLEAAIPYQLVSSLKDEKLDDAKLQMFDYGIILPRNKITKESLENEAKTTISIGSKYKTHKFLLSDNKVYLNKGDWLKKKSVKDFNDNIGIVPDDPEFFQDADFMYFYYEN